MSKKYCYCTVSYKETGKQAYGQTDRQTHRYTYIHEEKSVLENFGPRSAIPRKNFKSENSSRQDLTIKSFPEVLRHLASAYLL